MLINVTKSQKGSPDGLKVIEYEADQQYDMPEHLGKIFIEESWGEEADPPRPKKLSAKKGPGANKADQPGANK